MWGSSPLTRGKPDDGRGEGVDVRLIPAHAGKTTEDHLTPAGLRAHPRSRGENSLSADAVSSSAGSSPLTRGKRPHRRRTPARAGLIPAHAGKTVAHPLDLAGEAAHPRSRGENRQRRRREIVRLGSSPLTRGKHVVSGGRVTQLGLIPAHAGKTLRS